MNIGDETTGIKGSSSLFRLYKDIANLQKIIVRCSNKPHFETLVILSEVDYSNLRHYPEEAGIVVQKIVAAINDFETCCSYKTRVNERLLKQISELISRLV